VRRLKNSVGIWAFGPHATRFMPSGYHPEAKAESMVERTKRAVEGLGDLVDGFEYHWGTRTSTFWPWELSATPNSAWGRS